MTLLMKHPSNHWSIYSVTKSSSTGMQI